MSSDEQTIRKTVSKDPSGEMKQSKRQQPAKLVAVRHAKAKKKITTGETSSLLKLEDLEFLRNFKKQLPSHHVGQKEQQQPLPSNDSSSENQENSTSDEHFLLCKVMSSKKRLFCRSKTSTSPIKSPSEAKSAIKVCCYLRITRLMVKCPVLTFRFVFVYLQNVGTDEDGEDSKRCYNKRKTKNFVRKLNFE